jgi:hypothetical protein
MFVMGVSKERRIALLSLISKLGAKPTDTQKVEIERKRQEISRRLNRHTEDTALLFSGMDKATMFARTYIREPCACAEDEVCGHLGQDIDPFSAGFPNSEERSRRPMPGDSDLVERLEVPLPSSVIGTGIFDAETEHKEVQLRIAQAEEALHGIRREVGYKSFLFKANRRLMHTKDRRLRGHKVIADADREVRRHVRLYNLARASLMRLPISRFAFAKYQEIKKSDLKPLASIYGPNDVGGSRTTILWIWSTSLGKGEAADSPYMVESEAKFKRPHKR